MKDEKLLELVRKASQQNKDAYVELCNLKAREVIYLCTLEMRNKHDGEDAAQEVFIRMQRYIPSLAAPEAFNVWLNRLVHSTCLNMKRDTMKHKNSIPLDAFADSDWQDDSSFAMPQEFMEDAEKRKLVSEIVEDLPEKYRNCVVLHYYQSLNYVQIGEVLGITTDAVNNNLRMARKYMKRALEDRQREPTGAWAMAPTVAFGPVLAMSLQESAALHITPASIANCLAAAGVPFLGAAPAGGAGSGSHAVRDLLVKVVAPVAVVATIVGTVMFNLPGRAGDNPASAPPASVAAGEVSAGQASAQDSSISTAVPGPVVVSGTVSITTGGGSRAGLMEATLALVGQGEGARQLQAVTDASGAFRFAEVPLGDYQLHLTLPGWSEPMAVALGEGESFTIAQSNYDSFQGLDINLDLQSSVSGHIALQMDGGDLPYNDEYLPGIKVMLLNPLGELVAETQVHGDGTYAFEDLLITQAGTFTLRVEVDEVKLGMDVEIKDTLVELYPGCRI